MAGGLIKFEIVLDSTDSTFSPGEMVAGRVIVELGRAKTIRGIKIRFNGKGEVKWPESGKSGAGNQSRWHIANEEYFRLEIYVLGKPGFHERVEIPAGLHIFPFNFILPHNIPSSFEHELGFVRYIIKAIIDRPWKFDHHASILVTLETPYDLSTNPAAKIAIQDSEIDTLCCFSWFNVGLVMLNIHIAASGFAIGETIEAKIAIVNTSTSVVATNIDLALKQKITLQAKRHSKKLNYIVQNVGKGGPFDKTAEMTIVMQVPTVPPSNFPHCNIIDIEYFLLIEVHLTGCHCSIQRSYPILIGTRPALAAQSMQAAYVIPVPVQNPEYLSNNQPEPTAPFFGADDTTSGTMLFPEKPRIEKNVPVSSYAPNIPYGLTMANCEQMPGCSSGPAFQYLPVGSSTIGLPIPGQATTSSTEMPPPAYDICMNNKM